MKKRLRCSTNTNMRIPSRRADMAARSIAKESETVLLQPTPRKPGYKKKCVKSQRGQGGCLYLPDRNKGRIGVPASHSLKQRSPNPSLLFISYILTHVQIITIRLQEINRLLHRTNSKNTIVETLFYSS